MSWKKVRSYTVEDVIHDLLGAIKINRKLASKMSIIHELLSDNKIIREGAFNYLNVYLTQYYKDLNKPKVKVETEEDRKESMKQARITECKRVFGDDWEYEYNVRYNV